MDHGNPLPLPTRLAEGVLTCLVVTLPYMSAGHSTPPTAPPFATPWDGLVPYVPTSVWVYLPGYLLVFVITTLTVRGARAWRAGLAGVLAMTMLSLPFFLLYPVAGPRFPDPLTNDATSLFIRTLHSRDPIGNTFPSLHVANATFCAFLTWQANRRAGVLAGLLAVAVAVSTVTLKQHWLVDIPAGMMLAGVAVWLWHRWVVVVPERLPAMAWLERLRGRER